MSYREGRFWQPDVTVATVVVRDGRLLVVEEQVNGRLVLNQPAGHLEPDESLVDAALRETREETGWDVRLTAFVGAYQWKAPPSGSNLGRHYLRFVFAAEPLSHDPALPLDTGIVKAMPRAGENAKAEVAGSARDVIYERSNHAGRLTGPVGDASDDLAIVPVHEEMRRLARRRL